MTHNMHIIQTNTVFLHVWAARGDWTSVAGFLTNNPNFYPFCIQIRPLASHCLPWTIFEHALAQGRADIILMIAHALQPWGYRPVSATEGVIRTMLLNQSVEFLEWVLTNKLISESVQGPLTAEGWATTVAIFEYVQEIKGEAIAQALYDKCYPKNDSPLSTQSNSPLIFSNQLQTPETSSSGPASPVGNLIQDVLRSPEDTELPRDRIPTQPPINSPVSSSRSLTPVSRSPVASSPVLSVNNDKIPSPFDDVVKDWIPSQPPIGTRR